MAGGIVSRTPHFALHRGKLPGMPPGGPGVGALVPKRWARRAVTRNAIKRQIYTLSAERMPDMPLLPADDTAGGTAYVVRLHAAFARSAFPSASSVALKQAVHQELSQLLDRVARP